MPKDTEGVTQATHVPNQVGFASAVVEAHKLLGRIEVLCENPHWTSEHRWQIADLARKAQHLLEESR